LRLPARYGKAAAAAGAAEPVPLYWLAYGRVRIRMCCGGQVTERSAEGQPQVQPGPSQVSGSS
jgi:hypothetical protein